MTVQTLKVWQCVGCGRIDHPRPCVGICRDEKAEYVAAADYQEAARRIEALEAVLRRIAFTTPRPAQIEAAWHALQADARRLLAA